ncbi:MAG TPA: DUF1425 domain-containing protein [Campylobacterales bacterium]|nr:DUF1425 domain-containing protein [Campylobacterales bacterium]
MIGFVMKKISIVIALMLIFGCASNRPPVSSKSASNVIKSISNEYIINNIPLDYHITIPDFKYRFKNNLLEISVSLQNLDQKLYELEYRVIWEDEAGFEIDKTPWLPITINAMENKIIQQISHNPEVENFKFYIRAKQ